jgi:hypothetical protein
MSQPIPNFHDDYLTGIQLGKDDATLRLERLDGTHCHLVLTGLRALHIDNFSAGNIICYIDLISGVEPKDVDFTQIFPAPHPEAAARFHEAHSEFVATQIAGIVRGETTLVILAPSYGASLIAHCAEVRLKVDIA